MADLTVDELQRLVEKVEDGLDAIDERLSALEDFVGKLEVRWRLVHQEQKDGGR